jgi:hypothetical protein
MISGFLVGALIKEFYGDFCICSTMECRPNARCCTITDLSDQFKVTKTCHGPPKIESGFEATMGTGATLRLSVLLLQIPELDILLGQETRLYAQ